MPGDVLRLRALFLQHQLRCVETSRGEGTFKFGGHPFRHLPMALDSAECRPPSRCIGINCAHIHLAQWFFRDREAYRSGPAVPNLHVRCGHVPGPTAMVEKALASSVSRKRGPKGNVIKQHCRRKLCRK
jgi:hypothetical protein